MDATLQQGLILMAIGMSVVFSFLIIMVGAMQVSGSVIRKFFPEVEKDVKHSTLDRVVDNHADIVAIIAAVKSYTKH